MLRSRVVLSLLVSLVACAAPGGAADTSGDGPLSSTDGAASACAGCRPDQVCVAGACQDVPKGCPCPKESYCDLGSNTCKIGCLADDTCDAGRYCDVPDRTCRGGCRADTECGARRICEAHACVVGCRSCPSSNNECVVDACTDGECTHTPKVNGVACRSDGNICTVDACQAGVCTHAADPSAPICSTMRPGGLCVDSTCRAPTRSCDKLIYPADGHVIYYCPSLVEYGDCSDAHHLQVRDRGGSTMTYSCPAGCRLIPLPGMVDGHTTTIVGCW